MSTYEDFTSGKKDNFWIGLLIGAVAGATIGLLYAPMEGKELRRILSYRLSKAKESLEELLQRLNQAQYTSQAKLKNDQIVSETKEKAEKLLQEVELLIEQIQKR